MMEDWGKSVAHNEGFAATREEHSVPTLPGWGYWCRASGLGSDLGGPPRLVL